MKPIERITVPRHTSDLLDKFDEMTLKDALDFINTSIDSYGESATFRVMYSGDYTELEITYCELETDYEYEDRVAYLQGKQEKEKKAKEIKNAKERKEYERLKKKFEGEFCGDSKV